METLQHHTNLVTVKPPPVQPELSRSTRMCQRILWSNLLRYHGEAENPRMTIGVQSTNEERKCATRHNVFTLPPQDQPYVPTAQGPLNGKWATAAYIIQLIKMDLQMRLHFNNIYVHRERERERIIYNHIYICKETSIHAYIHSFNFPDLSKCS